MMTKKAGGDRSKRGGRGSAREPSRPSAGAQCDTCVAIRGITKGTVQKCRWCRGSEHWHR